MKQKVKQPILSPELGKKMTLFMTVIVLIGAVFMVMGSLNNSSEVVGQAVAKPQCNDQRDNDGDGYCDYLTRKTRCVDGSIPGDLDCASSSDNKESPDCEPVPERCDGYDNNCNNQIDEGLPIACSSSTNCGTSGWAGSPYCGGDGNVYRDYINYQCNFPGTCSSSCSSQTTGYTYQTCSNGCTNGMCNANDSTPIASAQASPTNGGAPLVVTFTGSATLGDAPLSYSWNFGDGASAAGQTAQNTYQNSGSYNAVLTVTDADGDTSSSGVTITVGQANLTPIATASASPQSGTAPLTVMFTGSASGGNAPLSYLWNFGDGQTSTAQSTQHTYALNGSFVASFRVTDADGDIATSNVVISVSPQPFDFTVTPSPNSAQVIAGNAAPSTVWVNKTGGTTQLVSLSHLGCPTGAMCYFSSASGNPTFSTTFWVLTSAYNTTNGSGTPAGTYPITLIGTGGGLQRTAMYTLVVN